MEEVLPIATIQDMLKGDYEYRSRRHAEWTDNYLHYRSRVITNRLTQRQSINVPWVKETVRAKVAKTKGVPDLYLEDKGNDKQKELEMNELWLDFADRNLLEILDIVDRKQEGLYGRSFMKLYIEDGKVCATILDPQDVLLDRFMKPWDIRTARHVTHTGIYRTLSELRANPMYDQKAVERLATFFATKAGVLKAAENAQMVAERNERLRKMGVPNLEDPKVGETYIEINEVQVKKYEQSRGRDIVYVIPIANGTEKLCEKPMLEVMGVNRYTICTWAGDVEATDIYSDGDADIARPMNQLANIRISQKTENGTLINYGMQFYDTTDVPEGWSPAGYQPEPFAFFPFPGNPNDRMKRVDIPEMREVFQEIAEYKAAIESATATTPITKGEADKGVETLGEIQIMAAQVAKRISDAGPLIERYYRDIAELFAEIVNAQQSKLSTQTLYKKNGKGTYYPKDVNPAELHSPSGWKIRVTLKAKRDAEALEMLQKIKVAAAQFPNNIPLQKILKKRTIAWLELKPEEEKEVLDFDEMNPMAAAMLPGQSSAALPGAGPAMFTRKPAMSAPGTSTADAG